jgi:hypothetical protein
MSVEEDLGELEEFEKVNIVLLSFLYLNFFHFDAF